MSGKEVKMEGYHSLLQSSSRADFNQKCATSAEIIIEKVHVITTLLTYVSQMRYRVQQAVDGHQPESNRNFI